MLSRRVFALSLIVVLTIFLPACADDSEDLADSRTSYNFQPPDGTSSFDAAIALDGAANKAGPSPFGTPDDGMRFNADPGVQNNPDPGPQNDTGDPPTCEDGTACFICDCVECPENDGCTIECENLSLDDEDAQLCEIPLECESDEDCDDLIDCTAESCVNGLCEFADDGCDLDELCCDAEVICRSGETLDIPDCDDEEILAHNQDVLDAVDGVPLGIEGSASTFIGAQGHFEEGFEGQLVSIINGIELANAAFWSVQVYLGHLKCGPSMRTLCNTFFGTKGATYSFFASTKSLLAISTAGVAAAAAWYHVFNVAKDIQDDHCTLRIKYGTPRFKYGAKVATTSSCNSDETEPCANSCGAGSCSSHPKLGTIDILENTKEPTTPLFYHEAIPSDAEEGVACNADWVSPSLCAGQGSGGTGWCLSCRCGPYTAPPKWFGFSGEHWNIMMAFDACRTYGCYSWGWNYSP